MPKRFVSGPRGSPNFAFKHMRCHSW